MMTSPKKEPDDTLTIFDNNDNKLLERLVKSKKAVVSGANQMKEYIEKRTLAEKKAVEDALDKYHKKVGEVRNTTKFKAAEERYHKLCEGFNKDVEEAASKFSELVDTVKQSKNMSEEEKEKRIESMYHSAMNIIYPEHKTSFQRHLLLLL